MFQIVRSGEVSFLQAPKLLEFKFVTHAFCSRRGGVSQGAFASLNMTAGHGDAKERVRKNWRILSRSFDMPERSFFVMNQVHSDEVLVIRENPPGQQSGGIPAGDACVTQLPEVALCIKTADCVPVFLVDVHQRVIGAVHAGWGGTALQITARVVDVMVREFQCRPADIRAAIGPSIGPCCYEVDSRVYLAMRDHHGAEHFFSPAGAPGKWTLDLPLANRYQLLGRGLANDNIELSGFCTVCRPDLFFSHRRDAGKTGRHVNFILLKGKKSQDKILLDITKGL
ncbi:peptidoglycan editing factor PgeF [Syntrophus aciditrophicus]|uniref:Purine nucleoside phosphorylase n=1 Tax=Syntrophus aciditrophicus (strain SB) TaxID=56780 RepID=Q2LWV5_SYNAS|nr:peptidoglycan editing factor PgeF [Syntrophus aciditrophicus]ABC78564.1 hypothetical protein SYN_01799 [Syntrophus aciditrophicus SB]